MRFLALVDMGLMGFWRFGVYMPDSISASRFLEMLCKELLKLFLRSSIIFFLSWWGAGGRNENKNWHPVFTGGAGG